MKVLDLQCSQGHSFEGWFGSQVDYDTQRERGQVTCPLCNDSDITKMLSAPRLNLGHGAPSAAAAPRDDAAASLAPTALAQPMGAGGPVSAAGQGLALQADNRSPSPGPGPHSLQQMQTALLEAVRHVLANTEDVGSQFAEEARKIHYGESEERNIRGQATPQEAEALLEEGIAVLSLPVPEALKKPLH